MGFNLGVLAPVQPLNDYTILDLTPTFKLLWQACNLSTKAMELSSEMLHFKLTVGRKYTKELKKVVKFHYLSVCLLCGFYLNSYDWVNLNRYDRFEYT